MSRKSSRIAAAIAPLALIATVPTVANAATAFYGVTADNKLVQFQSDNTAEVPSLPIRGLAADEKVVGIDIRPLTGDLYGITNKSRIVKILPRNAEAKYVDSKAVDPALTGSKVGFDFNPTVDKIRVETDAAQNLRIDPITGQLATAPVAATPTPAPTTAPTPTPEPSPGATPDPTPTPAPSAATPAPTAPATMPGKPDGNLQYAAGDPGAGTAPKVTAAAYTNSFPLGTTTELFALDSARRTLVKQDPPNDGTLKTIGGLNQTGDPIAFDIAENNAGYAAISTTSGGTNIGLYRVNLTTGAATPVGAGFRIGTTQPLTALAAAGEISNDNTRPKLSVASSSTQLRSRLLAGGLQMTVNANEAVTGEARVKYRNRTVGTADVEIKGGAGSDQVTVNLSSSTRDAIRRGSVRLDLRVEIADGAGNRSDISRPIRSR
jgi:hypothetical protein